MNGTLHIKLPRKYHTTATNGAVFSQQTQERLVVAMKMATMGHGVKFVARSAIAALAALSLVVGTTASASADTTYVDDAIGAGIPPSSCVDGTYSTVAAVTMGLSATATDIVFANGGSREQVTLQPMGIVQRTLTGTSDGALVRLAIESPDGSIVYAESEVICDNASSPPKVLTVKVKPVSKYGKIKVDVDPNLPKAKYWRFTVQKSNDGGVTWKKWRSYKTKTKKEIRYPNPKKGLYRVYVPPQRGYDSVTSVNVTLKR